MKLNLRIPSSTPGADWIILTGANGVEKAKALVDRSLKLERRFYFRNGCAVTSVYDSNGREVIKRLSRIVLGVEHLNGTGRGSVAVRHRNGDLLDCRRENLYLETRYAGVCNVLTQVIVRHRGIQCGLGSFDAHEASRARMFAREILNSNPGAWDMSSKSDRAYLRELVRVAIEGDI